MSLVFVIYNDCDAFFFSNFFYDITVADEAQRPVPWRGSTAVIEQITFILIKISANEL